MLLILLIWMALLEEAVKINMGREEKTNLITDDAEEADQKEEVQNMAVPAEETCTDIADSADSLIRVLLMDTGYQSYYHQKVSVICGSEEVTYTTASPELSGGMLIFPEQQNGITITSIERQQGNPAYRGCLEVRNTDQGLLLINELPLETYLESVVPSEMPSSYEMEALKAQAVCARTYAYYQIEKGTLKKYNADVDDSVRFQVYGNTAPCDSTTNAVRETRGQVLCQNGELIQAYYFSTSAGVTSTDEIWGAAQAASYLNSVPCEFDQEQPWSLWTVSIPWRTLEDRCTDYIKDTYNDEETTESVRCALKTVEITRKNQSGAVTGLHVAADTGSFDLTEEYSVREFLSPSGCTITEKDGTVVQGGTLLPSAYFTMKASPGESILIYGKGYGHGVGMSQTAASEMAEQGYDYKEILDYFFRNVEILSKNSTDN